MCGRYALGIVSQASSELQPSSLTMFQRAAFVRHQLEEHDMPVADAPEDDDVRQTYNFAPGYHGLVYRADVPDHGAGERPRDGEPGSQGNSNENQTATARFGSDVPGETRYKLQSMKWGLVPFWTKRNPDYSSVMKAINARDDSLAAKGGMWNTMKQRKRCIVVAQGFYEWLKKNGGKEKIPHFTKRRDEQLMCFAGLWDCVTYEGSDEKHYTYSIITTDSNKQLSFLHDRMPVILENGSEEIRTWLDPSRSEWSKELQSLLKPFHGELECYPVSKDVGKVGNNSPSFIVPVASSENKNNIANFFGNTKKQATEFEAKKQAKKEEVEAHEEGNMNEETKTDDRTTIDHDGTEDHAPLPVPSAEPGKMRLKRDLELETDDEPAKKTVKVEDCASPKDGKTMTGKSPKKPAMKTPEGVTPSKKTRSATTNGTAKGSPVKLDGTQQITNFFK